MTRLIKYPKDKSGYVKDEHSPDVIPIKRCRGLFKFLCPKVWQELTPTADRNVRFCPSCRTNVQLCATTEELAEFTGDCAAVVSDTEMMLGRRVLDVKPTPGQDEP